MSYFSFGLILKTSHYFKKICCLMPFIATFCTNNNNTYVLIVKESWGGVKHAVVLKKKAGKATHN